MRLCQIRSHAWPVLLMALALVPLLEAPPPGLIRCLKNVQKSSRKSILTTPISKNYAKDRFGYLHQHDYKPRAIYHPASEADVAAAVRCAAIHKVPIAPRSGGHSYEGYGQGGQDGSLVIHLDLLQHIDLDPSTGVVTVGGGVRLGPLYKRLWEAGQYFFPAGTCPSVGIGGHALGGGLGVIGRKYGMASDNVVGMTMVDAKGNIRVVNATSHPDLFWALRGAGGGSFGVVTEFRLQAHKAPTRVTTLTIEYPTAIYPEMIDAFGQWGKTAPEELMVILGLQPGTSVIKGNFLGSIEHARAAIEPLLKLIPHPGKVQMTEGTWLDAATHWAAAEPLDGSPPAISLSYYWQARSLVYRQPLSRKEMDILYNYMTHLPAHNGTTGPFILIDLWGGKIDRPSGAPSAFDNHRGVLYSLQFGIEWGYGEDPYKARPCPSCHEWNRDLARALHRAYSSGPAVEAYQNYIERDMPLQGYYGANLPRLMQVKRAVDPTNVFSFPQVIPLQ